MAKGKKQSARERREYVRTVPVAPGRRGDSGEFSGCGQREPSVNVGIACGRQVQEGSDHGYSKEAIED
jgi:hypothetical protein